MSPREWRDALLSTLTNPLYWRDLCPELLDEDGQLEERVRLVLTERANQIAAYAVPFPGLDEEVEKNRLRHLSVRELLGRLDDALCTCAHAGHPEMPCVCREDVEVAR